MFFKKWNDKMGINGVRQRSFLFFPPFFFFLTKVLIQHYLRLGGPKKLPVGPPILKDPKQAPPFAPVRRNFKSQEAKFTMRNFTSSCWKAKVRLVNQVKD